MTNRIYFWNPRVVSQSKNNDCCLSHLEEKKNQRIFLINAEKVMNRLPIHNKNLRKKHKEKIL